MLLKIAAIFSTIVLAFLILSVSVLKAASISYDFRYAPNPTNNEACKTVEYELPYPGVILPDSPFWPLKAIRDRVWLMVTTNTSRKAELNLLFANKRMAMAKIMFEKSKPELGYSTYTKAEKYLEAAGNLQELSWRQGMNSKDLSIQVALAALKHREVSIYILNLAPEDAKPGIIKTTNYSIDTYKTVAQSLVSRGYSAPNNPFQ